MKRKCKGVDITDLDLIIEALYSCFKPIKKRLRFDTIEMFAEKLNVSKRKARVILKNRSEGYNEAICLIAEDLQRDLREHTLKLTPIRQCVRIEPSSRKERVISVLGIRQLMLDHIAVAGLSESAKRVGQYQVSSIKGKGASYGFQAIRRWLSKKSCKYAVKLDIKNFYGSVDKDVLMGWLSRRVKNKELLRLVDSLINTVQEGIAIGSYLSQTLANVYLSDLYHLVTERCRSKRGINQVKHALFYMDDMLLLGTNKRHLFRAANTLIRYAKNVLGLAVKPNWQVYRVTHEHPVDMMGYRFSHNRITIRKRVFKTLRRTLIRIKYRSNLTLHAARRMASYYGYLVNTDSKGFLKHQKACQILDKAFQYIKYEESCQILRRAQNAAA